MFVHTAIGRTGNNFLTRKSFSVRSNPLKQRISTYDRATAAVAGALKDETGEGDPPVKAEIFSDAQFERLEAEGRQEFAAQIERLRGLLRDLK